MEEDIPPRKGKSNMIMTYEELSNIHLALQKLDLKLTGLDEKLEEQGAVHVDHEVRIRALELAGAGHRGVTGFATWVGPILISIAMLVLGVLNYLKP